MKSLSSLEMHGYTWVSSSTGRSEFHSPDSEDATMKRCRLVLGLVVLVCVTVANRPASDKFEPDENGYIRNWLVLAPIPLEAGQSGAEGLNKIGLKDEGTITPKEGDQATVNSKEYKWKKCQCTESHLDFN